METTQVPAGYKVTDLGVLPEEWEVKSLAEIAQIMTGNTPPTSDKANYGAEFLFAGPVDLGKTKYVLDSEKKLSKKGFAISRKFPAGSTLFTCIGSTIGKTGLTQSILTSNQQINAAFPKPGTLPEFLYYILTHHAPIIKASASEQAVPLINKSDFGKVCLPLPPPFEQQAIAAALGEMDALLAAQRARLVKQRAVKQGLLQGLLSGAQRLPGFAGEWEVKRLGDFVSCFKGRGLSKGLLNPEGTNKCLLYGELFAFGEVIKQAVNRTNSTQGLPSRSGDILMPGSTTTVGADLATASVLQESDVLLGGDINVFRGNTEKYSPVFLAFYLGSQKRNEIAQSTQGVTIHHLYGHKLLPLQIEWPSIDEQRAIADVLSAADAHLTALEAEHAKTQLLKQGMMQNLLTGKIRLV